MLIIEWDGSLATAEPAIHVRRPQKPKIGLNWYLTPDETHNGDGRHISYLDQEEYRECDPDLWLGLRDIVKSGQREVRRMENDSILQATFFSDCLDFAGKTKTQRVACRSEWFARSLDAVSDCDVVCVDPDNGLIVPSAMESPRENKYVLPQEIASYYAQGSTVVYYQHKARRKDPFYTRQLDELLKRADLPGASGLALKYEKVSQRYYLFAVQPRHRKTVEKAVRDMLSTAWGDHFHLLSPTLPHRDPA